jgi:hypothetical protein
MKQSIEWVLRNDGHEEHVRDSSLSHLILWGKLTPTTEVLDSEDGTWKRAASLPRVAPALRASRGLYARSKVADGIVSLSGWVCLVGVLLVCFQVYVYLREGEWPSASLYQLSTFSLPPITANAVRMPELARLGSAQPLIPATSKLKDNSEAIADWRRWYRHTADAVGLRVSDWQVSLVLPEGWFGAHRLLVFVLRSVSFPGAFLISAFLLFMLGGALIPGDEEWTALDDLAA